MIGYKEYYSKLAPRVKLAEERSKYKTGYEFAKALGISSGTYYSYINKGTKTIREIAVLKKMAELSGLNEEWLASGHNYPIKDDPNSLKLLEESLPVFGQKALNGPVKIELLQSILEVLLPKALNLSLTPSEIASIQASIYSELDNFDDSPENQAKIIGAAVTIALKMHKK